MSSKPTVLTRADFDALAFGPHRTPSMGLRARANFPNGYGASVIQGPYTYGGDEGLYELAVLGTDGEIIYDTPITNDVLGRLTPEAVTEVLQQIAALPALKAGA